MKTVEELRRDLRILARTSPEISALIGQIEHKIYSWERVALHLFLEVAGDSKPSKQVQKPAKKG